MSKISKAFENGKAFIPFITCGDPDLKTTEQIIYAMVDSGADLIELGIPFSDPVAEGVVIESASQRALKSGVFSPDIFAMVERVRKQTSIPMVFMTYANVVFSYGKEKFMKDSSLLGIDGLILPDVPFEERAEFEPFCKQYNMDLISFISPTSKERIAMIAKNASGFLYCISSLGVTGVRQKINTNIKDMIKLVKQSSEIKTAIGFGIQTKEQAKEMCKYADGVIVGSAIVKLCEEYKRHSIKPIASFVKEMKKAILEI